MKKRSFILTAVLLILAVALPFSTIGKVRALAEGAAVPAPVYGYEGYELSTQVKETFKDVDLNKIVATVGDKKVYENGEFVANDYFYAFKLTKSSGDLIIRYTAKFGEASSIALKIKGEEKVAEFVINKKSFDELKSEFKYNFDLVSEEAENSLKKYKSGISKDLTSGDTFTVPSLKNIVNIAGLDYSNLQKTVYYAYSGTGYTSTTSSTFTLSGVGDYRFYVEFKADAFDANKADKVLKISAKGLYEKEDGFYAVTADFGGTQKAVYAERNSLTGEYKYYEFNEDGEKDEDKKIDESVNPVTVGSECLIPVFTFNVKPLAKPTITMGSTYQERGFIGQEYTVSSITVKNAETVKYTLVYSATADGDYKEASEKLVDNSKFTPEKTGYYKVRIYAMSENGGEETKETAAVEVKKAFETVKYKVGFKDWLSVNKLPFVFLCISAACLVGIILLIVINPKPKDKKVKEEDK